MPNRQNRGIRHAITSMVPNWLSNRPGLNAGFKILYSIATMGDTLVEMAFQGVRAAFPGLGTYSALPYIGQSRGLLQGIVETNAEYAARLINYRTAWRKAGSDEGLALQVQAYVGGGCLVRVITRNGPTWVTANADGSTSKVTASWDWDSVTHPERAGDWSDLWIVIYPTPTAWTVTPVGGLPAIWGNPNGVGFGHAVPRKPVDDILQIVESWKGAHTYVRAIIWSYDNTLCVPGGGNNPNGTWGDWGYSSNPNIGRSPARSANARYWIPAQG